MAAQNLVENFLVKVAENAADQTADDSGQWKGFSVFLHVFLSMAGIAFLWGQRGILAKMLLQLDRSCLAVYCPSLSNREKLLKWASGRLPPTWASRQSRTLAGGLSELWKDGSLLCTLINSVVPGACPNPHRHWRKPPLHAQALAYKYLGLVPIFTEHELCGELTINQERNFIHYLQQLQEAINKWPTKDEVSRFSSQFVARGMGLSNGEQHRKTVFYLYSPAPAKNRSSVLMYIRGPYGTRGKATISPLHDLKTIPVKMLHDQLQATKILPFKGDDNSFLKTISLDFASLVISADAKASDEEIPIEIVMETDRVRITYIPHYTGIYEINIICDGELLRGSPYLVQIVKNASGEKDCFDPACKIVHNRINFSKRRIISKVIDCIDEKICIINNKVSKILKGEQDETIKLKNNGKVVDRDNGETFVLSTPPKELKVPSQYDVVQSGSDVKELTDLFEPVDADQVDNFTQFPGDVNNNKTPEMVTMSRISFEISPDKSSESVDSSDDASPICPGHIDPEVEPASHNQLTLSEKRKLLSKQSSIDISSSDTTYFSLENDALSSKMSVLNVLGSLRQSRNSLSETYSITSTVSLPNMTDLESNYGDDTIEDTFASKRNYWEQRSSRSSSGVSLANSDYSQPRKRIICPEKYFKNAAPVNKSMDTSLEDCTIIPLEERKKRLLKEGYDKERRTPKTLNFTIIRLMKSKSEENDTRSAIPERVQHFQPNYLIGQKKQTSVVVKNESNTFRSQFKRAVSFFKSLEDKAKAKEDLKRRHSLNLDKHKNRLVKRNSLNLPNVPASFTKDEEPRDVKLDHENVLKFNLILNAWKGKRPKSTT